MRDAEKWAEKAQEYKESGESQRIWSAKNGVNRSTLRYWLDRIEQLETGSEIRFSEIMVGDVC